jgi:transcriptional regulator with XRE-family HTH domain
VTVAELVVSRREARGWNQYELAKRAKLSPGHLWKIENGEFKLPRRPTRDKLGAVLGLREEDWFRAAGVIEDDPDEPAEVETLPMPRPMMVEDKVYDPARVIAFVRAHPDEDFQAQLDVEEQRRTPESFQWLIFRIFRAWTSNAQLAMELAKAAGE